MPTDTIKPQIMEFFGMTEAEYTAEWKPLPLRDKKDLLSGIRNGTLTYG